MSIAAGAPLPSPEYVPPERPEPILAWIGETLRAGRLPHIHTFASLGVRLCRTALAAESTFGARGSRCRASR